ncbi:MAG: DUF1467 family protein [Alphaproteobacteria bacterium]
MDWISGLAIYFVLWWLVLFMVLPWGVRNRHETGDEAVRGEMHGAPVQAMMWRKVLATTIVSAILFAGIWWVVESGVIDLYGRGS